MHNGNHTRVLRKRGKVIANENAIDKLCILFNLMELAEQIDADTVVHNNEYDEDIALVPLLREAYNELQWLLDKAGVEY